MTDILVIEDNKELAEILCDFLVQEKYRVFYAATGEEGISYLQKQAAKIVLLDIMLPGMDGFAVCQWIRTEKNIPLIVISAKVYKEDKLNAFSLGADDYIEKPYDIDILLAKIRAVYSRFYKKEEQNDIIIEQDICIDKRSRIVTCRGEKQNVTGKEYELLLLFLENKGKVLHKEWIFNQIWGQDSFSEPSTLTVHIKWLREKIEQDSKKPEKIRTVWGVGYCFHSE